MADRQELISTARHFLHQSRGYRASLIARLINALGDETKRAEAAEADIRNMRTDRVALGRMLEDARADRDALALKLAEAECTLAATEDSLFSERQRRKDAEADAERAKAERNRARLEARNAVRDQIAELTAKREQAEVMCAHNHEAAQRAEQERDALARQVEGMRVALQNIHVMCEQELAVTMRDALNYRSWPHVQDAIRERGRLGEMIAAALTDAKGTGHATE